MADRPRPAARLNALFEVTPSVVIATASEAKRVAIQERMDGVLRRLRLLAVTMVVIIGSAAVGAGAVQPGEKLADPALEARAREISKDLRCLVCQNQSIDDSDAELAHDLRVLVRERLAAGDSDGEVTDYVVSRYGDFVLLRPPFKASTYALWLGPLVIFATGGVAVIVYYRRRRAGKSDPAVTLSEQERLRLAALMEDEAR